MGLPSPTPWFVPSHWGPTTRGVVGGRGAWLRLSLPQNLRSRRRFFGPIFLIGAKTRSRHAASLRHGCNELRKATRAYVYMSGITTGIADCNVVQTLLTVLFNIICTAETCQKTNSHIPLASSTAPRPLSPDFEIQGSDTRSDANMMLTILINAACCILQIGVGPTFRPWGLDPRIPELGGSV